MLRLVSRARVRVSCSVAIALGISPVLAPALARAAPPGPGGSPPRFEPFERPGEGRLEAPVPGSEEKLEFILPALPAPSEAEAGRLSRGPAVVVREFRVTGSSVFSPEETARVTAPYVGRPLATEELQQLRDQLTRLYVDAGYLTSGALLPDQAVSEGVVEYRIVEGQLDAIEIEGERWFRPATLQRRLSRAADAPLDVRDLEQELQLLQQDPRIRRVNAELIPGEQPGEARLLVRIEEELPWLASLELSNHESPSSGAYRAQLDLAHRNLTGRGDVLRVMTARTDGLEDYEVGYELPFTDRETSIGAWLRYGESDVVEQPFDEVDIASNSTTAGLSLRQPLYRSLRAQLDVALLAEYRESETFLLGEPFPFGEGTDKGRSVVSVVRLRQDWLYRDLSQVFAARSQLSLGLDALGATQNDGRVADGQFLAWLGQFQWLRRFDPTGVELLFRADVQLASSALLSLEQYSVGGSQSVRGYRENQLVRDNGWVASLEARIPLWRDEARGFSLQLAPFVDVGGAWNSDRAEIGPDTLTSAGVGLRFGFSEHLHGDIYWAEALRDLGDPADPDLQDDGVHFSLTASF